MPIEVGIWRIDGGDVIRVAATKLAHEARLEEILERDISILGLDVLLVVGRQVVTDFGKRIDLLAVDAEGSLYAVELKRDSTPGEIVAQLLDYGSWLRNLDLEGISDIHERYARR